MMIGVDVIEFYKSLKQIDISQYNICLGVYKFWRKFYHYTAVESQ